MEQSPSKRHFFLIPVLRWEAARSLAQLGEIKILSLGLNDTDKLVKKMVELGMEHSKKMKAKIS